MAIELEIVSRTRLLMSKTVDMVVVPGVEGDLAAMERHAPIITLLRGGIISVYQGSHVTEKLFVSGGFAEITETRCTVLADEISPPEELSPSRAQERLAIAEARWADVDKVDIAAREAAMDELLSAREEVRIAGSAAH